MTDIVEALRSGEDGYELAAADEIERLRGLHRSAKATESRLEEQIDDITARYGKQHSENCKEIERLCQIVYDTDPDNQMSRGEFHARVKAWEADGNPDPRDAEIERLREAARREVPAKFEHDFHDKHIAELEAKVGELEEINDNLHIAISRGDTDPTHQRTAQKLAELQTRYESLEAENHKLGKIMQGNYALDKIAELEAALEPLARVGKLFVETVPDIGHHALLYSPAAGLEYSLNSQHALDAYAALKEQSDDT